MLHLRAQRVRDKLADASKALFSECCFQLLHSLRVVCQAHGNFRCKHTRGHKHTVVSKHALDASNTCAQRCS